MTAANATVVGAVTARSRIWHIVIGPMTSCGLPETALTHTAPRSRQQATCEECLRVEIQRKETA